MKYTNLQPAVMDDVRFLKLGIVEDSGLRYVVVGKMLPDRTLIWDADVGKVWCEEISKRQSDHTVGKHLVEITEEGTKKAMYAFLDQSGMLSRFAKMVSYLYQVFPSPERKFTYTATLESEGLHVGLSRIRESNAEDVDYHRLMISQGMHMEGVSRGLESEEVPLPTLS